MTEEGAESAVKKVWKRLSGAELPLAMVFWMIVHFHGMLYHASVFNQDDGYGLQAWLVTILYLLAVLCVDVLLALGKEPALAKVIGGYWAVTFLITLAAQAGIAWAEDSSMMALVLFASFPLLVVVTPLTLLDPMDASLPFDADFGLLLAFCGLHWLLCHLIDQKRK